MTALRSLRHIFALSSHVIHEAPMFSASHCEAALHRIAQTVAVAVRSTPAITVHEALEQIAEELDLAGFAALEDTPSSPPTAEP